MKAYSYLALGDSYTIGEQVSLAKSFPYQTVQWLRKAGYNFHAPEIIATTGWITDELKHAIDETFLLNSYDFVSLLVGVNNQFRSRSVDEFRTHFRLLLEWAIQRANEIAGRVIVLSIPDWSVTPFAADRDRKIISKEISTYNFICQAEAEYFHTGFVDITTVQSMDGSKDEFLAPDKLHPSGEEYAKWAELLCQKMIAAI
ncbi:MAG: GDSL-type esterase/lipase family protein [Ferruginibacter sp.]